MNLTDQEPTESREDLTLEATAREPDEITFLADPNPSDCHIQISRVVHQIGQTDVRRIVGTVFQDLLRLLECLQLIESHLRQVDAANETFALFQIIHDEACSLVTFIREEGLNCGEMNEDLVDALDGITFAVNHDLQRVFETTPAGQNPEKSAHVVVGKLYRAHDILTNCLQQSTITLAMLFDAGLVGAKLFNNSDMRYRQSLQLCQDLSDLILVVEKCEETMAEVEFSALAAGIEKFRSESMECLMYSDWPQFESFCEKIKSSAVPNSDTQSVLHQFRCYLETLLGQVRMRAVLANVFPIQFGGDDNNQKPTGDDQLTRFEPQDDETTWSPFAYAV